MGTAAILDMFKPVINNLGYQAPQQELVLLQYQQNQEKNKTAIYLAILAAAVLIGLGLILYLS